MTDDVRAIVAPLWVGLGLLHSGEHTLDALRLEWVNTFAVTPTADVTNIEVCAVEVATEMTYHAVMTVTVTMCHHHCFGCYVTGMVAVVVNTTMRCMIMATEAKIDAVTMAYAKVSAATAIMSVHKISPVS
ncbi:hypothetical protein KBI23_12510 [bacterium]|nr:hypothetical protein [bacterium]